MRLWGISSKFGYVGDTFSLLSLEKHAVYISKHNFGVFLCTPTYCVPHENKKVQNRNDIPHFSFKILA
jgi:hypothetical protein